MFQNLPGPNGGPSAIANRQDNNWSELCDLVCTQLFFQGYYKGIQKLKGPTTCEFCLTQNFQELDHMAVFHSQQIFSGNRVWSYRCSLFLALQCAAAQLWRDWLQVHGWQRRQAIVNEIQNCIPVIWSKIHVFVPSFLPFCPKGGKYISERAKLLFLGDLFWAGIGRQAIEPKLVGLSMNDFIGATINEDRLVLYPLLRWVHTYSKILLVYLNDLGLGPLDEHLNWARGWTLDVFVDHIRIIGSSLLCKSDAALKQGFFIGPKMLFKVCRNLGRYLVTWRCNRQAGQVWQGMLNPPMLKRPVKTWALADFPPECKTVVHWVAENFVRRASLAKLSSLRSWRIHWACCRSVPWKVGWNSPSLALRGGVVNSGTNRTSLVVARPRLCGGRILPCWARWPETSCSTWAQSCWYCCVGSPERCAGWAWYWVGTSCQGKGLTCLHKGSMGGLPTGSKVAQSTAWSLNQESSTCTSWRYMASSGLTKTWSLMVTPWHVLQKGLPKTSKAHFWMLIHPALAHSTMLVRPPSSWLKSPAMNLRPRLLCSNRVVSAWHSTSVRCLVSTESGKAAWP